MTELERLIERARHWDATATPEQKEEMYKAQRESWVRAFAPCEHGMFDFEQCGECRSPSLTTTPVEE